MEDEVPTFESESLQNENNNSNQNENESQNGNPKLADALAKVLRMGKNKTGKSIVLSKAKLYSPKPVTKKTHGFEIVPDPSGVIKTEDEDVKPEIKDIKPSKRVLRKCRVSKQEKLQRGKIKPSPLDREKEKPLVKIATRGVVHLFNAVRQQQAAINKQINKPGITEGKKEKILKSIDKKAFLDVLRGIPSDTKTEIKTEENDNIENEVKSEPEEEPSWQVLRDDFMMGAKLKDWDKKEMEMMEE